MLNVWQYLSISLLVQTVGIIPIGNHPISIWGATSVSVGLSNIVLPVQMKHNLLSYHYNIWCSIWIVDNSPDEVEPSPVTVKSHHWSKMDRLLLTGSNDSRPLKIHNKCKEKRFNSIHILEQYRLVRLIVMFVVMRHCSLEIYSHIHPTTFDSGLNDATLKAVMNKILSIWHIFYNFDLPLCTIDYIMQWYELLCKSDKIHQRCPSNSVYSIAWDTTKNWSTQVSRSKVVMELCYECSYFESN